MWSSGDYSTYALLPTPQKWRVGYISKLRDAMAAHNTALHLQDLLCTALTKWFDTGTVQIASYRDSFYDVLKSQQQIGWHHLFMGHWSTKWEGLHTQYASSNSTEFVWTVAMVEADLTVTTQLWEQHNSDVHGKSELEQKQKLL